MPNSIKTLIDAADQELKCKAGDLSVSLDKQIRSISHEAAKSTYYFPVLVSNSVTQKSAFMISENLQYMYAYFIRACFSLAPAIKVKVPEGETVDVEEYLKRFHKNSGISGNEYFLKITSKNESADLEDFVLLPNEPLNEATKPTPQEWLAARQQNRQEEEEARERQREADSQHRQAERDKDAAARDEERKKEDNRRKEEEARKYREAELRSHWSAGAVEKANATNPLTIPVECTFLVDNHELKIGIPVGIKTVVHDLDSRETADRIVSEITGHSFIRNLIRWKSGEIESIGDVLELKDMKKDIAGDTELNKWMDIVTRRKILNRLSLGALQRKPFLPNMSIVVSMDDIDYIERTTKMNLLKQVRYAYKLMKECLLLSFVIVDEANSTAWILYDGRGAYEEVPFSSIKRDSDKQASAIDRLLKVFA